MIYIDTFERISVKMYALHNFARQDRWNRCNVSFSWLRTILVKLGLQSANENNTSGKEEVKKDKENEKSKEKKKPLKTREGSKSKDTQERFMLQQFEA